MNEMKFLLQNQTAGFIGNSPVFWRLGGSGYTQWIDEAEQFSEEAADLIIRSTRGSHVFIKRPLSDMLGIAKRTVDMQDIQRGTKP